MIWSCSTLVGNISVSTNEKRGPQTKEYISHTLSSSWTRNSTFIARCKHLKLQHHGQKRNEKTAACSPSPPFLHIASDQKQVGRPGNKAKRTAQHVLPQLTVQQKKSHLSWSTLILLGVCMHREASHMQDIIYVYRCGQRQYTIDL